MVVIFMLAASLSVRPHMFLYAVSGLLGHTKFARLDLLFFYFLTHQAPAA